MILAQVRGGRFLAGGLITAVTLATSVAGLALAHEAIPALLRPMFGSIPLTVQLLGALRSCLIASVLCSVLLPEHIRESSILCFGMGASLSLALASARQIAKAASPAGPLTGALWALTGLLSMPTIFGALLWNRCLANLLGTGANEGPRAGPPLMALRAGLALAFVTCASKARPFIVHWTSSYLAQSGTPKGIVIVSLLLLICGSVSYRNQARNGGLLSPWIIHATLLALSAQSAFHTVTFPIVYDKANIRVLNSTQSVTGQIVVADNIASGYRFIRCDHSLLGGRWIKENERGTLLFGDSIFSTFVLQEVGRLAWRNENVDNSVPVAKVPVAEIIGLGAGITADALIRHGYKVRVIELDPAVYHAAKTYLNLGEPDEVVLEDGLRVVSERGERMRSVVRSAEDSELSDLVIHDCFTGGSVPAELFTVEFWNDLALSIKADGILVVNFAGVLESEASRAVLNTLWHSFPQCRAFQDKFGRTDEETGEHLANMVVICSMTFSPILSFRPAETEDFLRSPMRLHVLSGFLQHEVLLDRFILDFDAEAGDAENYDGHYSAQELLRRGDGMSSLDKWQIGSAAATWNAMREIMPVHAWMAY